MKKLRIALIAPPWFPIPPKGYGGIELVVHLLYKGLVELGHDVLLIGALDSEDIVNKNTGIDTNFLKDDLNSLDRHIRWDRHFVYSWQVMNKLISLNKEKQIDIIHDHTRPPGLFFYKLANITNHLVYTVHESIPEPRISTLNQLKNDVKFIALSEGHKNSMQELKIDRVIYNAVDSSGFYFTQVPDSYMLQIARINPDKGQHISIEVAKRTNTKLILAGKIDPIASAQEYFKKEIEPNIGGLVEYIPSVTGSVKDKLISESKVGIYPVVYEEPFGLAIAESLASGVPVLTSKKGAMPELVREGIDGYSSDTVDGLIQGFYKTSDINRDNVYLNNKNRFSYLNMAKEYEELYYDLVKVNY